MVNEIAIVNIPKPCPFDLTDQGKDSGFLVSSASGRIMGGKLCEKEVNKQIIQEKLNQKEKKETYIFISLAISLKP